jgi:hypothetical protein
MHLRVASLTVLISSVFTITTASAAEGMGHWTTCRCSNCESGYGFTPTKEWVDKVMRASVRLAQEIARAHSCRHRV